MLLTRGKKRREENTNEFVEKPRQSKAYLCHGRARQEQRY